MLQYMISATTLCGNVFLLKMGHLSESNANIKEQTYLDHGNEVY